MKTFEKMKIEELREAVKALEALRAHQQRRLKVLITVYHSWVAEYLQETNENEREIILRIIAEKKNQAEGVWETIEGNSVDNYEDFLQMIHPN